MDDLAFTREIAEIFDALAQAQEPLGADFAAVWDRNLSDLYEE